MTKRQMLIRDPYCDVLKERNPVKSVRGAGFHDMLIDELELSCRVAFWLDSENNMPELHFMEFQPVDYWDDLYRQAPAPPDSDDPF